MDILIASHCCEVDFCAIVSYSSKHHLDVARGLDHLLTDVPSEVIVLHSPSGNIHYVSHLASAVFASTAKLAGTSLLERVHVDDRERVVTMFSDAATLTKHVSPTTIRLVGDDGRLVWSVLFTVAVKDATGRVIELHSTLRDVTHQMQLRDRIVERDTLAHTTNTLAKVGGWYHDLKTNETFWSEEVRRIHEVEEEFTPNSESIRRFFTAEDLDRMEQAMLNSISNGLASVVESKLFLPGNRQKWIRVFFSIERNNGEPTRLYGATQDITEIKEREDELERLVRELADQRDRLEEFSHLVSHQLRAPVTTLTSIVSLLRETEEPEERMHLETSMFDAISSLERTLGEVGEAVRIRNEIAPKKERVYIRDVVMTVKAQLAASIRDAGATIEIDTDDVPVVDYPVLYLETVIRHLISNALRFAHPERAPHIVISTHLNAENDVVLEVDDNGVGIDMDRHRDRLFRLGGTFHRNASGRGTGLFMVKTMVESLGGNVGLISTRDHGTKVKVVLLRQNSEALV